MFQLISLFFFWLFLKIQLQLNSLKQFPAKQNSIKHNLVIQYEISMKSEEHIFYLKIKSTADDILKLHTVNNWVN